MDVLDESTSRLITASYALSDLETAVQQVIYNAIDADAKSIKLVVDIENASFTVEDDASSRLPVSARTDNQHKPYGSRGAFLYDLVALAATVEIESRVQDHWTSYRKVFKVDFLLQGLV
ncbi:hypothetical protein PsorP6_000310 [Peronosclerospora sorghi]|uniref:Uncharacterized protein n=1 Tax=Peronosclerospora sorghi TaxID=230839 RepID=A0ACC0WY66_9STRA|nr:hypothetical protein PsorP6_000310 [Peronosclerospora sorghi]